MEKPRIVIHYCAQCRFVLRATWLAQELLFTFGEALGEVALRPGSGGVFEVSLGSEVIFDRKCSGRFPESSELKQWVRDRVDPQRDLGHSERRVAEGGGSQPE
jgi:selenoprotein W-related protein